MPTVTPIAYRVDPTGFEDMTHSDKHMWSLFVTLIPGYGWAIRQGHQASERVMKSDGVMSLEPGRVQKFCYPHDDALALATAQVDAVHIMGVTAQDASDEMARRTRVHTTGEPS